MLRAASRLEEAFGETVIGVSVITTFDILALDRPWRTAHACSSRTRF